MVLISPLGDFLKRIPPVNFAVIARVGDRRLSVAVILTSESRIATDDTDDTDFSV